MTDFLWWRDGVIYQIYPRSYSDSNGDGFGDINGIISRLDYLSDLGIDAIWLSPIYPSPDKDFGYDVSDYLNIDPRYGSLADFDKLVSESHRRGIRIIMDMVLNHTSNLHPWFLESRSSITNPKRDWYIWADKPEKKKYPNNWQAAFGGPAWNYDENTNQYYLHLFTKEQPDVNWRNPDVRKSQLGAFRFWLDRGVDGFRLDVFNAYYKQKDFLNNPPKFGLRKFDRQKHIYDMDQPEMMPMLHEMRRLLDSYPETYVVGETYISTLEKVVSYCGQDKLHAAFSFDFTNQNLRFPWRPSWIIKKLITREKVFNDAQIWPTNVLSNHDLPRAATRYARREDDTMAKLAMGLLLTLRGTPYIYYGEEIGMRDIRLPRSRIVDPAGKKYWPFYKGRDGCRSPMQWDDTIFAGFSRVKSWLPVHPNYKFRNVAAQKEDPDSIYNFTRSLISLRKENSALYEGSLRIIKTPPGTLGYIRKSENSSVFVIMNFTRFRIRYTKPPSTWIQKLSTTNNHQDFLFPHEFKIFIHN